MGTHVQRKRFEHPQLAHEAANAFATWDPSAPGAHVSANAIDIDDEWWVYVAQDGDNVTGNEPLLPGYELISTS